MNDKVKLIVVAVVTLLLGAAGGVGYGMMQVDEVNQKLAATTQEKDQAVQNADRLRKMNDEASSKYGKDLGKLVMAAGAAASAAPAAVPVTGQPAVAPPAAPVTEQPGVAPPAADDGAKTLDSARAILAVRDGFRASLDGVRAAMNAEMDAMATELGAAAPDAAKIKGLLESLKQSWPEKEKNIQAATQRLLADLGLAQAPAAPKPAPAPAAPAPALAPAPAPADTKK
jgi:2-oxoglutarate dehydrogenase E2 component (dihydrolipoamide succinyltransferase)